MTEETPKQERIFPNALQTGIFQMLMTMISQYRATMEPQAAANKAADWLTSLANKIREEAAAYNKNKEEVLAQDIKEQTTDAQ